MPFAAYREVPAMRLVQDIHQRGWSVCQGVVPEGHLALCDCGRRQILFPEDFRARLACPDLEREVAHVQLAHELAHVVLHQEQIKRGERTAAMEQQATEWAIAYLLPEPALHSHPDYRALRSECTERGRWRRLCRVAEAFLVPVAFVQLAVEFHQGTARRTAVAA